MNLLLRAVLVIACLVPTSVHAQIINGRAQVIDGDSLEMTGTRIRLFGIDAPEGRQSCERGGQAWACGAEAAAQLREMVAGQSVECEVRDTDSYGRVVAVCTAGSLDLGLAMLERGLAISLDSNVPAHDRAQSLARSARFGLWGAVFLEPAKWRAANPRDTSSLALVSREPASVAERPVTRTAAYRNSLGCAIKGNQSRRGDWIYYLPGMNYYDETRPEAMFCTEAQALAAGYRRSRGG